MKKKIFRTACSFLILALHVMMFGAVQESETLVSTQYAPHWAGLKAVLYSVGIFVGLMHPFLTNMIGQRRVLTAGLLCDALGFVCFLLNYYEFTSFSILFLYLGALCFGLGILSVFNCLIIYIIWDYPKYTVMAITALFAFGNIGFLFDTVLQELTHFFKQDIQIFLLLTALLVFFAVVSSILYEEPPYPRQLKHLRSGTLLWKELHIRLFFFLVATICYSLTEGIFNFWGLTNLQTSGMIFDKPLAVFWLGMVLGQFFLLIPLAYGSPYKILFGKVGIIVVALLLFPFQKDISTIYFCFLLGGLGCAGIFPIILSLLEEELIHVALVSRHEAFLPFIDTAISVITCGYLLGGGIVDFWTGPFNQAPRTYPFFIGAFCILACCFIMAYLNHTRLKKRS